MNGIPALAQAVQSQGRNNDTQLVHMTPREVQGLESLAMAYGGSLTTNPRTGLKEAGFLDNILPTLAGAALTIGTGGAINPWMAAGIVGGVTGAATGNLEKGLMAGLGAYGGAGLGGAFAGTGQAMAGQAAQAGGSSLAPGAIAAKTSLLPAASQAAPVGGMSLAPGATSATGQMGLAGLTGTTPAVAPTVGGSVVPTGFEAASQGIQALGSEAGRGEFMKQVGGIGGLATKGLSAAGPALLAGEEPAMSSTPGMVRPYTYDPGRQTDQPGFQYRTGAPGESTAEQRYFSPSFTALTPYEPGSGSEAEKEDERRRMGISGLAAGSQGPVRMLRGGGDATSDSMDGMIDGEEPVKLATGEVVIDGRAVSEIGNGDNEAGAKKIEAAIERIHRIRQKAKRGKPSSADKTFASMIA